MRTKIIMISLKIKMIRNLKKSLKKIKNISIILKTKLIYKVRIRIIRIKIHLKTII